MAVCLQPFSLKHDSPRLTRSRVNILSSSKDLFLPDGTCRSVCEADRKRPACCWLICIVWTFWSWRSHCLSLMPPVSPRSCIVFLNFPMHISNEMQRQFLLVSPLWPGFCFQQLPVCSGVGCYAAGSAIPPLTFTLSPPPPPSCSVFLLTLAFLLHFAVLLTISTSVAQWRHTGVGGYSRGHFRLKGGASNPSN